ncbi:MAG: glycosyltransferase family 2 protein [Anaerolineae bacterium]
MASPQEALTKTDLAVVIVSWNVRDHLDRCLDALRDALSEDQVDRHVWVLDNASTDGTVERVRQRHLWVHLEALPDNLGYVKANNIALERAIGTAPYVWLLNPDTVVRPGTLKTILAFMDDHPRAGLVGPKLINPNGSLQESAFSFPGLTQALFALELLPTRLYYSRLNGRYPRELYEDDVPFQIGHPLGAAMLARSDTVRDVGLLDEGFFMYCEEIDWAWRMEKAGWERWLVPAAEVVHVGGASTKQARPQATAHLWRSRARLYHKHRGPLTNALVRMAVKRLFTQRLAKAATPEWAKAYADILEAWD